MGATALFLVSYHFQANLIHHNEQKRLTDEYQYFLTTIEFKKNMANNSMIDSKLESNIRQKAVVAIDFPTSLPVPKTMMALAISFSFQ